MIPNSITDVTPEWLTAALGETRAGVVIRGVTHDRVIHGTSSKWFVTVDRNDAAIAAGIPEHLCLKVNWEEHADKTLNHMLWCLEGRFYRYLRPYIPVPAPAGFYGDFDDATGQGICIMEDLSVQGATYGDNTRPLTVDQAADVLEDLTNLHVPYWGSKRLDEFPWLRTSFETNVYPSRGIQKWYDMLEVSERAATMSADQRDPRLWFDAVDRIVADEASLAYPRCLIHGDTHLGNSYYLPGQKLRWLDWQLVSKGRPPREVNYFLGGLDTPTRRANEKDLVKHYLGVLKAKGIDAPSFESFWESYRLWPIWGFLGWAGTGDGWQPVPTILETMRRFMAAAADLGTFEKR